MQIGTIFFFRMANMANMCPTCCSNEVALEQQVGHMSANLASCCSFRVANIRVANICQACYSNRVAGDQQMKKLLCQ